MGFCLVVMRKFARLFFWSPCSAQLFYGSTSNKCAAIRQVSFAIMHKNETSMKLSRGGEERRKANEQKRILNVLVKLENR